MNRHDFFHRKLPLASFVLALVLFILSMAGKSAGEDTEKVAQRMAERIEQRLRILERYVLKAQTTDLDQQIHLEGLPEDMVIYRYVNDSLQSWANQFSVINDDISSRLVFQRLTDLRNRIVSPLADVTSELSYMNLGPKWYLVKSVQGRNNDRIIAGIEIKNTLIEDLRTTENGVNPRLGLPGRYTLLPLNHSGGATVVIDDVPLFKIIYDSASVTPFFNNSMLRWFAMLLFALATVLFLAGHRTMKVYATVVVTFTLLLAMSFIWGAQMSGVSSIFSPSVYADGVFLFSLGSLLLLNLYITLVCLCSFFVRGRFLALARKDRQHRRRKLMTYGAVTLVTGMAVAVYLDFALRSLIQNSNIPMELYRWNDNTKYAAIAYLSFIGLSMSILLQVQTLRPVVRELFGWRFDAFSIKSITVFSIVTAAYFSLVSGVQGFRKEQDRVTVWANRLAVERNLGLEIQLRSVEEAIATDQLVSALTSIDNAAGMIVNRITETYLSRSRQKYNMSAYVFRDYDKDGIAYFNDIIRNGTPIASGSRFLFLVDANGRGRYEGVFLFYSQQNGLTRLLLRIEPNSNREDRGYYSILGRFSKPGDINIPQFYSYAKYSDDRLVSSKGNYSYPTVAYNFDKGFPDGEHSGVMRQKEYTHFMHRTGEGELIVISRSQRSVMVFFTSFSYLFLVILGITILCTTTHRKRREVFKNNYFRIRINTILFTSSILILVSMTIVSITFVYKRNEANMYNLMSSKINTLQALIEARVRGASDYQALATADFDSELENISNMTKSDITLYTPSGKLFRSTTPEVFEKMVIGSRMDEEAYYNIRHLNQKFFIHREKIADYEYWALYAPVFNDNGQIVAIISVPYTDRNYDFRREAFFHASLMVNIFLLLLIISLLFSTREVNALFSPLVEMGKKMAGADIHKLEYIRYKREDEISSLVDAYNRMVKDLSDSTRQLAQAERDKAWSQMARQVAHEIKNPLTPIKLEIQRLIRLKQNGNPAWEEKFDKVSAVVLEHIDILTETANEFSTFAKLYSEEPVLLDLDRTLKDQLMIFDNKENVRITYIGMENAYAMAPKPQLIRVFVNMLTNAIQAVEIQQREAEERGDEPAVGRVLICLRNSMKEGYYDIVFDDNGPGVSEENRSRLFTPNFTTKSSGTGLGLAICRNIIEKCEGEIRYQQSFALGGASFVVTLPKRQ
ncbi:MAG: cache domain-containing protein [Bacteroidales bacterium]|nr:cache domain-containing protein [Bacteroidales bacterium]